LALKLRCKFNWLDNYHPIAEAGTRLAVAKRLEWGMIVRDVLCPFGFPNRRWIAKKKLPHPELVVIFVVA
jgi:hypothetical protein